MKNRSIYATFLLAACLTTACSRTPEEAKAKLAELNMPATPENLLAQTKDAKSEDTAKLMVEAGVDPNARQKNGMTALMSAVFNNQYDVAKALLEKGADLSLSAAGYNALSLAVEKGDEDMVKLLLQHGADPKGRPGSGLTALEQAERLKRPTLVELLGAEAK